ncbi:hypothetical protein J437_LFUL005734 [Ladona fulva]|uniref:RNA/RNP complex-1-interacting phosphatase n=1 Tax=Ladona fulva TaxID=123851 RepID=A0A8K0JZX2_LADFU|nr:hypothetical protein J437_LFUL005734 [Ladona fulva]
MCISSYYRLNMGGGSKAIPERWQEYTKVGRPIPGTRIVCFKVPLKKEICRSLPFNQRFTPDMLMEALPDLVGVIDCTNTPRYYNNQELIQNGIQHEKIQCPGHVVPPPRVVQRFKSVMNDLWKVAESLGKYVGVHCTHGVNRSGYLICRYLIECRGFHPEEAIKLFRESRGHPIERGNYLKSLRSLTPNGPLENFSDALRQLQRGITSEQRHPQRGQWRERNQMENRSQSQQQTSGSFHNNSRNYGISRIQGQYRNPINHQSYNGYHDSRSNDYSRNNQGPSVRYSPMYSRNSYKYYASPMHRPSNGRPWREVPNDEFYRDVSFEGSNNFVLESSQHDQPIQSDYRPLNPSNSSFQKSHHQRPQYSQFQPWNYHSNHHL